MARPHDMKYAMLKSLLMAHRRARFHILPTMFLYHRLSSYGLSFESKGNCSAILQEAYSIKAYPAKEHNDCTPTVPSGTDEHGFDG